MKLLFICFAILATVGSVATDECTKPGVCEGLFEEEISARDLCDCYARCFFHNSCFGYTFSKSSGKCTFLNSCDAIEESDDCQDCISGTFACAPQSCSDDKCLIPMSYTATAAETTSSNDICECYEAAMDFPALFYTFESDSKRCKLYLTTDAPFEECATCQTGVKNCLPKNC